MKTLFYQGKEIELNYSTTLNHLIPHQLWQCGLSLPALGLAGYLYTLPKQWRLSVTHLSKQLAMSKNTCRKYLKEIFSNEKAREVFKVKEVEINTYDFEEGLTAYDYASDTQELENFTSSVAKDVSEPNRKKVLLIQTQRQRYLLNLCFRGMDSSSKILESQDDKKVDSSHIAKNLNNSAKDSNPKNNAPKNAQNLNTIKRDSKESLKDSSSKRTREKSNNDLTSFLDLQSFSQNEQEAIKLWIRYKQESARKSFKPSQIDFQLRKITRLKEQGQDICAVIEKSLDMGWQGLFPIAKDSRFFVDSKETSAIAERYPLFCHAVQAPLAMTEKKANAARNDRITPKMPKNIGAKALLCVK